MVDVESEVLDPAQEPTPPDVIRERLPLQGALGHLDFFEEVVPPAFQGGPTRPRTARAVIAWSLLASLIDTLVVFSIVCLFMAFTLFVERLGASRFHLERAVLLKSAFLVFLFLYSSYLVMLRVFLGNSLGEWSCDLKLGEPRQRFSSRYSLLVLLRFAVVVGTGVITLPLISLMSGTDWAGKISGLPLISLSPSPRRI